MSLRRALGVLALAALGGCGRAAPPSQFPDGEAALARMRATYACSHGVSADAKIDYFDDRGRVRGSVLYLARLPDQVRFDVLSPLGSTVMMSLSSDGREFALYDLGAKSFLRGPAKACNVSRFTRVPVPPFALVQLLRGEAPVLVHAPGSARVEWQSGLLGGGDYSVTVPGQHGAVETVRLVPVEEDWDRPWNEQRVRVLGVSVEQGGAEVYSAELDDHRVARTAAPFSDPDGLEPDVPPSGPSCTAEVPRALRIRVPSTGQDLILKPTTVEHNPPLFETSFVQAVPGGVRVRYADCED